MATDLRKAYKQRLVSIRDNVESMSLSNIHFDINEKAIPKFPKDPTILSYEEVGSKYAVFTQWQSYAKQKLSTIEAEILLLKSMLRMSLQVDAGRSTDTPKKGKQVERSSTTKEFEEELEDKLAEKIILDGAYEHYEVCAKALSREISRRKVYLQNEPEGSRSKTAEDIKNESVATKSNKSK